MKVYVTRDEKSEWVWLWLKPAKGPVAPTRIPDCDMVFWQRPGTDILKETHSYVTSDFEKKFGIKIEEKTMKLIDLPEKKIISEDYKIFSSKGNRKK